MANGRVGTPTSLKKNRKAQKIREERQEYSWAKKSGEVRVRQATDLDRERYGIDPR